MEKNKDKVKTRESVGPDFFEHFWEESWTYIKTVVDVVREPVVILDKNLRVMSANEPFYRTFQVEPGDTEGKTIYELGNGQWNIPALRTLLEEILPSNTFFKGFEVVHEFPLIGPKTMILNARHIHFNDETTSTLFPPIIMLAIEDVTEMMAVAQMLGRHASQLERKLTSRTKKLEEQVRALEKKLNNTKFKAKTA